MCKYKIFFTLLMCTLMLRAAYCQEESESRLVKSISGTVISMDAVGSIISIRKDDQQTMAFLVPDKATIRQETHNIGLMDIGKSDSVSIQYYISSSAKNIAVSIVDNESVVNE